MVTLVGREEGWDGIGETWWLNEVQAKPSRSERRHHAKPPLLSHAATARCPSSKVAPSALGLMLHIGSRVHWRARGMQSRALDAGSLALSARSSLMLGVFKAMTFITTVGNRFPLYYLFRTTSIRIRSAWLLALSNGNTSSGKLPTRHALLFYNL